MVVGAPGTDSSTTNSGVAYIFEETNSQWILKKTLTGPTGREYEFFGWAVEVTADEIFISYSNEGILSLSDIESLLKQTYSKVIVHKLDYRRFKTNSRKQNSNNKVKEFLFNGIK